MSHERTQKIEELLTASFSPVKLLVKDQSHLHVGHEGAKSGAGHFHVTIVSHAFDGCTPIQRHRMVYETLASMMQSDIHALRIDANTPDEL